MSKTIEKQKYKASKIPLDTFAKTSLKNAILQQGNDQCHA
jgi:hypothetical protein